MKTISTYNKFSKYNKKSKKSIENFYFQRPLKYTEHGNSYSIFASQANEKFFLYRNDCGYQVRFHSNYKNISH